MATQLRRDPFARATLMRETLPAPDRKPCEWCGQPGRFVYWWADDGWDEMRNYPRSPVKRFCSVSCFEIHYA